MLRPMFKNLGLLALAVMAAPSLPQAAHADYVDVMIASPYQGDYSERYIGQYFYGNAYLNLNDLLAIDWRFQYQDIEYVAVDLRSDTGGYASLYMDGRMEDQQYTNAGIEQNLYLIAPGYNDRVGVDVGNVTLAISGNVYIESVAIKFRDDYIPPHYPPRPLPPPPRPIPRRPYPYPYPGRPYPGRPDPYPYPGRPYPGNPDPAYPGDDQRHRPYPGDGRDPYPPSRPYPGNPYPGNPDPGRSGDGDRHGYPGRPDPGRPSYPGNPDDGRRPRGPGDYNPAPNPGRPDPNPGRGPGGGGGGHQGGDDGRRGGDWNGGGGGRH